MKNLVTFFLIVIFISCSNENLQSEPELKTTELNGLIPKECDGYNIFPNEQYDCGWKRGYTDWVYHYNYVAADYDNYTECYKIEIVQNSDNTVRLIWKSTNNSHNIIQTTKNLFQDYYDDLAANQQNSDFALGHFVGYAAGRGQQPYAPIDDGSCD